MTAYEPNPEQIKKLLSLTSGQFREARLAVRIFSEALDCEIFLVSEPELAREVDGPAYTPDEIGALAVIKDSLKPHYNERLKKIHDAKGIFGGIVVGPIEGDERGADA